MALHSILKNLFALTSILIPSIFSTQVIVTGGSGNIGKYLIAKLLKLGFEVISIDIRGPDIVKIDVSTLKGNVTSFKFIYVDIRNSSAIIDVLKTHDVVGVIHLAAVSQVRGCSKNKVDCRDINVKGTESILHAISNYNTESSSKPWLLFPSSREIYGNSCSSDSQKCVETSPTSPLNVYALSKLKGETLVNQHFQKRDIAGYIILRLSSVYGGLFDIPDRLIPSIVKKSMADYAIDINGGGQTMDFIHMHDLVNIFLKSVDLLEKNRLQGNSLYSNTILVCNGKSNSVRTLFRVVSSFTRTQSPLRLAPFDNKFPEKYYCNNEKMISVLGYRPKYDFATGLAKYIQAIYKSDLKTLKRHHTTYCSSNKSLNTVALDGCKVVVSTLLWDSHRKMNQGTYGKLSIGINAPLTFHRYRNSTKEFYFIFNNTEEFYSMLFTDKYGLKIATNKMGKVVFRALFDHESGGYLLKARRLSQAEGVYPLAFSRAATLMYKSNPLTLEPALGILPVSCPPRNGKAHLPLNVYDPFFYQLREIIDQEKNLPGSSLNSTLHCRRVMASMDLMETRSQSSYFERTLSTMSSLRIANAAFDPFHDHRHRVLGNYNHAYLPLCDDKCELFTGCIKTDGCRCREPMCHMQMKSLYFPFPDNSFTDRKSYPAVGLLELAEMSTSGREPLLPLQSVLTPPALEFYRDWLRKRSKLPSVSYMNINYFNLVPRTSSVYQHNMHDEGQKYIQNPSEYLFLADYIFMKGIQNSSQPLSTSEFAFMPFFQHGIFSPYFDARKVAKKMNKIAAKMIKKKVKGHNVTLIYPVTHDYGGAMVFKWDMREFRVPPAEGRWSQINELINTIVMGPMGDYNTLFYLPHKDIVIPSYTAATKALLEVYGDVRNVKKTSHREYLISFSGSVDERTGSLMRIALMEQTLFPRSKIDVKTLRKGNSYVLSLGNTKFCPHMFGVTGWANRLQDTIYSGCIPVLTSDITDPPFSDLLDWSKFSVYVDWRNLGQIEEVLLQLSPLEVAYKQKCLLSVRDVLIYDLRVPSANEFSGKHQGPLFMTLLTLRLKQATTFPE